MNCHSLPFSLKPILYQRKGNTHQHHPPIHPHIPPSSHPSPFLHSPSPQAYPHHPLPKSPTFPQSTTIHQQNTPTHTTPPFHFIHPQQLLLPTHNDGGSQSRLHASLTHFHPGGLHRNRHYCVFQGTDGVPSLQSNSISVYTRSSLCRHPIRMISALLLIDAKGKNIVSRYYRFVLLSPPLIQ